ncbi:MAG: ABC transporter ATP-binding protein [Anaerolineae bacterium]|nr:ABC transporter ATP-binding protein [Anaerolineae bacterium]
MNQDAVIRIDGLTHYYGHFRALDNITLQVGRKEVFGFLGPNGAGKSTTIGILLGLQYPTSGKVEILGERVSPMQNQALRKVGAMFGAPGFIPYLSGKENLQMLARISGVDETRAQSLLEQVGLSDAAKKKVSAYSLGMRQRLALAAALVHQPDLLILDEPTNGLDPVYMREFRELVRSLAQSGVTVFLSSHLLYEVEQICDRVAMLHHGQLLAQGTVDDLLGSRLVVRVRVSPMTTATEILKDCPGVQHIQAAGDYLDVSGIPGQQIVACLAHHDIYPSEVVMRRNDLEETFMKLIEEPQAEGIVS